jgi:hypothetical protein
MAALTEAAKAAVAALTAQATLKELLTAASPGSKESVVIGLVGLIANMDIDNPQARRVLGLRDGIWRVVRTWPVCVRLTSQVTKSGLLGSAW